MAEIKISELSIGDWVEWKVYDNTYVIRITQITDILIRGVHDGIEYGVLLKQISPIRLTPEILEKNGFVRQDTESGIKYTLIEENTMFGGTWVKSVFQWIFPMDFRFVHQLQHALRLAGVEKELEV